MIKHIIYILLFTGIISLLPSCSISQKRSKKLYQTAIESKPYDVVIIPGFPFENGQWHKIMRARVVWANYLYKKGYVKNIIFSGSAVYSPYYESKIMALYAQELGIDKDHIFTESKAEHSTENVYYSYKLAKTLGFTKVALATDPYQSKMLIKFIRKKMDNTVDLFPIQYDTLMLIDTINPTINPISAYDSNFVSITERESSWQRFKGTLGKNINYNEE